MRYRLDQLGHWDLALPAATDRDTPRFVAIAQAIATDIRRGRLRPGQRLPGSRRLAEQVGVHRNTVLAAYAELAAEGWISTSRARGTFVSTELPERAPRRFAREAQARDAMPARVGYELAPAPEPFVAGQPQRRGVLLMAAGIPDVRLFPDTEFARAYRRVLRQGGRSLLTYGEIHGHPRLRQAIADMLSATRGLAASADNVLITRGSQMAIFVAARALIRPGDVVAVENPGYRPAWEALRLAGARLVPLPVDSRGADVGALAELVRREPVRAVYVTPHHQHPTTATMSPGRRLELLELARAHRIAILEDDYDHEFHYDGRPVLPLASADAAGSVIYLGTLSKVLAPGLRIGYLVAPVPLVDRAAAIRSFVDLKGDHALEAAVAELLDDGIAQRHIRRARRIYHARRDALAAALSSGLADTLSFPLPAGGLGIWARARRVDVAAWQRAAERAGVIFHVGRRFEFDGRAIPFVRFGFALLGEAELREAVRRLAASRRSRS